MSRLSCNFWFHKWGRWEQDISVVDGRYFVARSRVCKRCGLADLERGFIANATPPKTPTSTKQKEKK